MFLTQFPDQRARFADLRWIQPDGRLVENEDRRVRQQGVGQADTLAKSLGQSADELPANVVQPAAAQDVIDALPAGCSMQSLDTGAKRRYSATRMSGYSGQFSGM